MAGVLPFQEAIDFLAGKVNLPTYRSDDLKAAAHVRAFSVAGVTRDDMLADFAAAILRARTDGRPYEDFRKSFDEIVDRTGWVFKARGKTDEERRDWRARIIFNANMRVSYMAGRYAQMTDPDVLRYRPYWRYVHSGAEHPRLQHLAWDGRVWSATDPVWTYIYPPNGFGCGCDVEALSRRDLLAEGKTEADPSPELKFYDGRDPRTGLPELRVGGIDRGWEYNAGEEWLSGIVPRALRQPLAPIDTEAPAMDLPELPLPTRAGPDAVLADNLTDEAYAEHFLSRFGLEPGEEGFFRDRSGGIITISQRLFEQRNAEGQPIRLKSNKLGRGRYVRLMAEAIQEPDEIWVNWARIGDRVVLRRSYLRRFVLANGQPIFVSFEWTGKGWHAATGFDASEAYLQRFRRGAILYRKR
ncbi:PBECR2 nuclease fold domain-containing protein [Ensifer soli]|uniref:PBECR2 nuclease fold domain-containing protein n=1 Tax=Ciceribacter sp. sgz301302 TaxID=3342379 RepID=UPI0035B8B59D